MNLADFLLARIAEDEAAAREVLDSQRRDVARAPGDWPKDFDPLKDFYLGGADGPIGYTVMMAGVGRVLAECEAKRRIVEEHAEEVCEFDATGCAVCSETNHIDGGRYSSGWPCETLAAILSIYSEHPDCRDEWRRT